MTYLRIVKNKATMITFDRTFLEDKRLGLAERGLLAWLLQQANGTRLHIKDLKRQLPDTKMHIDTALLALIIAHCRDQFFGVGLNSCLCRGSKPC